MKTIPALLFFLFFGLGEQILAQPKEPPSLSLVKAAMIAEAGIKSLNLPKDHFFRYIAYLPARPEDSNDHYRAYFEPNPKKIRVKIGELPGPRTYKYIRISLDGQATLIEETRQPPSGEIIKVIRKEL